MATLVLTAAGAALGGVLGPVGAMLGQAAGAIAGSIVDAALFGATREVGRLTDLDVQTSTEGAPIPRVFGRVRIAGQVIWATRFEEEADRSGGKGLGPKVKSYRYFANVALGLCEGPIAHVGRVWANGELLDTTAVVMRVHLGGEGAEPDSLILAKEGPAPAYRGTAVVVFEHLPLRDYGNALPQFTFEVIRPVGRLERKVRAVTLIPGATEYGYAAAEVQRVPREGVAETENRHAPQAASDLDASLDELTAVCPALEAVALVVAWFGDDLDCAACTVRPKVEDRGKATTRPWSVAGLARSQAEEVSRVAGRVSYGGSPSDDTVVDAIKALKARGLEVTFYPFVMMDVPPGNGLADPWGGTGQPAFPWRGRITVSPAPGRPGSPDGTAAAVAAVSAFVGSAAPSDFTATDGSVAYAGPPEWSLRRMILHYAHLCAAAGGVDTFLIGSEFRSLTAVRGPGRSHPFVAALAALASDVRAVVGPGTAISYAADWSEYASHRPDDGSGDVDFHLDPLWAHPDIDFVGIDAYFPLTDWRDGPHQDRAAAAGPLDPDHLAAGVAGGEFFDWHYEDEAARRAGLRTPIADGAHGKPWVFRAKDLAGWWSNPHHDRIAGVESPTPTAWAPGMKPIRLTELGCPAVDRGANQPNLFPDTLSSEGGSPRFSHGRRDDAAQRRYIEAVLAWFDPTSPGFAEARNPRLVPGGFRMLDHDRTHLWTFDARPWPWFPLATDVWSDGPNWATGHWLDGRLGAAPLAETIEALAGGAVDDLDTAKLSPVVDGLVVPDRSTARSVVEALAGLWPMVVTETATGLSVADRDGRRIATFARGDLAVDGERPVVEIRRAEAAAVPTEVAVTFYDTDADGRQTTVAARREGPVRVLDLAVPVHAARPVMAGAAETLLRDLEDGRERFAFALPPTALAPEPGDVVGLDLGGRVADVLVERIEDGPVRRVEGRSADPMLEPRAAPAAPPLRRPPRRRVRAKPAAVLLDLPMVPENGAAHRPLVAVAASPWPGTVAATVVSGGGLSLAATVTRPATMGVLAAPLGPGPVWVRDRGAVAEVALSHGALRAVDQAALLAGANLSALGGPGAWELVAFSGAELVGPDLWRISGFLRGLNGTEHLAAEGHAAGARFVLLDGAAGTLDVAEGMIGVTQGVRISGADTDPADPSVLDLDVTPAGEGLLPYAPVRLAARRHDDGSVMIAFVRRTRVGGDRFDAVEVPLGEAFEAYVVTIRDAAGVVRRTIETATTAALYHLTQQIDDFGGVPTVLDVSVRQVSEAVGPGRETRRTFHV